MVNLVSPKSVQFKGKMGTFVTISDGTVIAFVADANSNPHRLLLRRSYDHGQSWQEPEVAFEFPERTGKLKMFDLDCAPVISKDGTLHVYGFWLKDWDSGLPYHERTIEMWHLYSEDEGRSWQGPHFIDYGHRYTGSLNAVTVLSNGRMVMPFSYLSDRKSGCFVSEVILSDDHGHTWRNAHADLVVDNGGTALESGAVEPVTVELPDGRVWMVIRTQMGRFFESYSEDQGETWSIPQPTMFVSSNAPAGLIRLKDDRILMCWNHSKCEPIRHGISYSRQSLAAAIRDPDGTWRGYREIMNLAPEQDPNELVCYPWMSELADGNVLVGYLSVSLKDWIGTCKLQLVRIDPDWVAEEEDLELWENGLQNCSVTAEGVQVALDEAGEKVLKIQKEGTELPVGITRNFPLLECGEVQLMMEIEEGFGGAYLSINESFMKPGDKEGGMFRLYLGPDGGLSVQYMNEGPYHPIKASLNIGARFLLRIQWNCLHGFANLLLDDGVAGMLPQLEQGKGIAYLRIHLQEGAGLRVKSIRSVKLEQPLPEE